MKATERPRWRAFALALALLALGAAALALGDSDQEKHGAPARPGRVRPAAIDAGAQTQPARDLGVALTAAVRFAGAYLSYERGAVGAAGERALARYSTPGLGRQLLAAPVHLPAGARPPRQRLAGIAGTSVGLIEGEPALLVGLRVAGEGGSHLLRASLLERGGRWLVAGIGP